MYHIKFFSVPPEKRGEVPEIVKTMVEAAKKAEGVEPVGLFFPRGSGYMYAIITRFRDYATWEKFWEQIAKLRQKGISIITNEMDMFFDEIKLE